MSVTWEEIATAKRQERQNAIPEAWLLAEASAPPPEQKDVLDVPRACGLLTARELKITETVDIPALLRKLASGEWSSVDVTTAYYKRAVVAQQLVNCLTEIFVERALKRAKELDEHLKATGKPVGPLHGLPVSLKDQFSIERLDTTMGKPLSKPSYTQWIGKPVLRNCTLVDLLLESGAVPFVRTNVPQTLMGGTFIGIGGAGSMRIPSAACGLYGLRPSYHRIAYRGAVNSMIGQDAIPSVAGPLANSLEALKIFMKAVLGAQPWLKDPLVLRKPWDDGAYRLDEHGGGAKLCFGMMWDDGSYKTTPPLRRAMEMTKQALLAAGHEVVDWHPLHHQELVAIALRLCVEVFNVLDFPAAVIPVTRVDPELDVPAEKHDFRNIQDQLIYEMYTPEKFENAPVGLQVVGRTQEEEAVIAMAEVVDAAVKAYKWLE
ncbi:amidase signature enzyme [Auricularia subglabra TFB-10046 SS5]|nr:amidase signature enzyme [Auricularia subglabra TFB-10046 SS5]